MRSKIGVSNRHVHLKENNFKILFGNVVLEKDKVLYQTNQFAFIYKLTINNFKNKIKNIRVLGSFKNYMQIEISKTDAYNLGLNFPVSTGGDLAGLKVVTLVGSCGEFGTNGFVIPDSHIHMAKENKEKYGLSDVLSVEIGNEKKVMLYDVRLKVSLIV